MKPTIINIVKVRERILRVINDEGAPQAVTILCGKMAMVPVGSCMKMDFENHISCTVGSGTYLIDRALGSRIRTSCRLQWGIG